MTIFSHRRKHSHDMTTMSHTSVSSYHEDDDSSMAQRSVYSASPYLLKPPAEESFRRTAILKSSLKKVLRESLRGSINYVKSLEMVDSSRSTNYFWGSPLAKGLYLTVLLTVLLRQPYVLHVFTLVFGLMLIERIGVWAMFCYGSHDFQESFGRVGWVIGVMERETEKLFDGSVLRVFWASNSYKFMKGSGKSMALSFLRSHTHRIRAVHLEELGNRLEQHDLSHTKWRNSSTGDC